MSATRDLIATLMQCGMDPADAAALVARAAAEMNTSAPSSGALRTRRWRENKRHQASPNVTSDAHAEASQKPSQTVTERHKPSQCDAQQKPPLILTTTDIEDKKETKRDRQPRKRHALPSDWRPPQRAIELAHELGLSIPPIEARFRDYLAATGRTYADYDAGFCNFVRNTPKFEGPQTRKNGTSHGKRSLSDAADERIARAEEQDRMLDLGPADYYDAGAEIGERLGR
jgi:Ni/Co efflux regulator RcnB